MQKITKRRSRLALGIAAVALVLVAASCTSSDQDYLHRALNKDRAAHGRTALPMHDALNNKAQAWAEKMARDGRLSHSSLAQGVPSCTRRAIGENVGVSTYVGGVEAAWMASTRGHRDNILGTGWDHVGVGVARAGGKVYAVQVFLGCG